MQEIYATMRALVSSPLLLSALDAGTHEQFFGSVRVLPAKVPNFTFGIHTSPRWQQETLTLVDAGIECNIPVPPLLGRADIIIIFDNSLDVLTSQAGELKKVEQYVKRKNTPFVSINYEHIVEKQCSVFFDRTNLKAPLIIYFPLINNVHYSTRFDVQKCMEMSFCGTQNFHYSAPQIKELAGLAQFNVMENAEIIRQAIKEYIQMRQVAK
jgi:phospholipase A2